MSGCDVVHAVVQVGANETQYLRCGRGSPAVVVLTEDATERLRLMRQYSPGCCVIAPVPAADIARGAAVEQWLLGVLEGLGLESPTVVVSSGLAALVPSLEKVYGPNSAIVAADAAMPVVPR